MKSVIQSAYWGMALVLLIHFSLARNARAQTLDPFNVTTSRTGNSSSPTTYDLIPLANGKILAGGVQYVSSAGLTHTNLVRLNADGSVDDSFNVNIGDIFCLAQQTNGLILAGGEFYSVNGQTRYNLVRLNPDGSLDASFNAGHFSGGINNAEVNCLLLQPDGKIVVGGGFAAINGQAIAGLCRLNGDGSLDTSFNAAANNAVTALALQPDGQIVVKGMFTSIGGQLRTNLARLNSDGSLDPTFQPVSLSLFGSAYQRGGTLALQPNGEILVGGLFNLVDGLVHTNLVRLNTDGTVDTNFTAQADLYDSIGLQSLSLQTDGKILAGYDSLTLNGLPSPFLGRLNADGSRDAGFNTNVVGTGVVVYSCALQADGRILPAGLFYTLLGQARNGLGRLFNTELATQRLSNDGTNLVWLRGGASPEVWRTSFETSTDGTNWTYLGDGQRITGGWELGEVYMPTNTLIRARGFVAGGWANGSSWFVESGYPQTAPVIPANGSQPGRQNGGFGFNVGGNAGSTVVIDATSDLVNWSPVVTNLLPSGPIPFSDPAATNVPQRFYRARLQP